VAYVLVCCPLVAFVSVALAVRHGDNPFAGFECRPCFRGMETARIPGCGRFFGMFD